MNVNQPFLSPNSGAFGRQQKRARGARIPVTIVTGFLGSGKTTLVRRFLQTPEGHGTAVIVNEYGAVGIDDVLLRPSADETVLLGNGCVCCNTRSDLQIALRRLVAERERGQIPDFRRILIETSGLADPSPILQDFRDRPRRSALNFMSKSSPPSSMPSPEPLRSNGPPRRASRLSSPTGSSSAKPTSPAKPRRRR